MKYSTAPTIPQPDKPPGNQPGLKQGADHQRTDAERDAPYQLDPISRGGQHGPQRLKSGCTCDSGLPIDFANGQQQEHADHQERIKHGFKLDPPPVPGFELKLLCFTQRSNRHLRSAQRLRFPDQDHDGSHDHIG